MEALKQAVINLQSVLNSLGAHLSLDGDLGQYTLRAYASLSGQPQVPDPVIPPVLGKEPKWIALARTYLGQKETPGKVDNMVIVNFFKFTSYWSTVKKMISRRDEVAWCAAFICAMLGMSGYKHSNSAAAKDSAKVGTPCKPQLGALATWKHLKGSLKGHYHTNFILEELYDSKGMAIGCRCIGGNQSNAVTSGDYYYKDHQLYACRMPIAG